MIQELTNEEMLATNGGGDMTFESMGEAAGRFVGKALLAYASLYGVFKIKLK